MMHIVSASVSTTRARHHALRVHRLVLMACSISTVVGRVTHPLHEPAISPARAWHRSPGFRFCAFSLRTAANIDVVGNCSRGRGSRGALGGSSASRRKVSRSTHALRVSVSIVFDRSRGAGGRLPCPDHGTDDHPDDRVHGPRLHRCGRCGISGRPCPTWQCSPRRGGLSKPQRRPAVQRSGAPVWAASASWSCGAPATAGPCMTPACPYPRRFDPVPRLVRVADLAAARCEAGR